MARQLGALTCALGHGEALLRCHLQVHMVRANACAFEGMLRSNSAQHGRPGTWQFLHGQGLEYFKRLNIIACPR